MVKKYNLRQHAKQTLLRHRRNRSALNIQLCFQSYCQRKHHHELTKRYEQHQKVIHLQKYARGKATRKLIQTMMNRTPSVVMIQSFFRGFRERQHDTKVRPAIVALRYQRWIAKRRHAATLIQSHMRRILAKFQFGSAKLAMKRALISATMIQNLVRVFRAKCHLERLRHESLMNQKLSYESACLIQKMCKLYEYREKSKRIRDALHKMNTRRIHGAICIQSIIRGHSGRKKRSVIHHKRMRAAISIQKMFRGSRIISWKHLKMNEACIHILKRQQREIALCATTALNRLLDKDTNYEEKSESTSEEKPKNQMENDTNQYEQSMIGLKCQIYWPLNYKYFIGTIKEYSSIKEKWLIVYDDGDREWMNLRKEQDRVLLFTNGSWKTWNMYEPPFMKQIREEKDREKKLHQEQLNKKKIALSWVPLGWDEKRKRFMYYSSILKKKMSSNVLNDFEEWKIVEDGNINNNEKRLNISSWYFLKQKTSIVPWDETDPRLEEVEESLDETNFKKKLLIDLRYASFLGRGLLEKYVEKEKYVESNSNFRKSRSALTISEKNELSYQIKQIASLLNLARDIFDLEASFEFPEKKRIGLFQATIK